MKIELSLSRARFVVDEAIEVQVRLHNDSGAPLRVPDPFLNTAWQPTYVVTGPAFPQGRRFSARSATSRDQRAAPSDIPLVMVELAPGATHEGELPLSQWCPLTVAGAYTIVAELELAPAGDAPGLHARSSPLAFQLDAVQAQCVSVGIDVKQEPPADLYASFVQAGADACSIYDAVITEDRPDLGELERAAFEPRRTIPTAQAGGRLDAVLVPWHNDERMMAMATWRVWLASEPEAGGTKDVLVGDDSPLGAPVGLPLPAGAMLVPPVWQDPSEALDVLVLEADRRRMQLARFTSHGPPAPPSGALVWRSDARGSIAGARLTVGPAALGSPRRVIALEAAAEGLVVSHYQVEPGGSGSPTDSLVLPQVNALPGRSLALRVTPRGHTRAWLLVDAMIEGWQVYLAHMEFDAQGRLVHRGDQLEPLVAMGSPLLEATLELVQPEGREPEQLAWALRTDDRRVLWSRSGSPARWFKSPRPSTLATPLQLCPLSQATYLATLHPGRAPRFVTLEDES